MPSYLWQEIAQLTGEQRKVVEEMAERFAVPLRHARKSARLANDLFRGLQPLHKLAYNLWLSWNHEAVAVFRERDEVKEPAAHRLFRVSLIYMFALFASLIVERATHIAAFAPWL